jgi:hypothetical protein
MMQVLRKTLLTLRSSKKARACFHSTTTAAGKKREIPCVDSLTRWNSTFFMIKSSLELKESLNMVCSLMEIERLTDVDWVLLEDFVGFWEKPAKLTDLIGGSDYLTIGLAGLVTRSLIKHCSIYIEGENELIAIAAEEILETIRNYET